MKTINIKFSAGSIRADQVTPGLVFRAPQYPGVGIRTCQTSHLRKFGGDATVVINCGVGVSILELSPSDALEIIGGTET